MYISASQNYAFTVLVNAGKNRRRIYILQRNCPEICTNYLNLNSYPYKSGHNLTHSLSPSHFQLSLNFTSWEVGGPLFNLVKCLLSAAFGIRRHLADAHDIASFEVAFSRFFIAAARTGGKGGGVCSWAHSFQSDTGYRYSVCRLSAQPG